MMNRVETLQELQRHPNVSVLIVGGGINGIGTFRDLALNGVDVLLVERGDFCSGASAASSHMAHGGIRYLENGEFRLVREAVRERNAMLQNAPHLVRPLPTTIPIFRRFSGMLNAPLKFLGLLDRPAERGSLVIKLGLMLYDAFTGSQRTVPRHRFMGKTESLRRWGALNPEIVNTATYYDGAILQPERLGCELIEDAETANGKARALNYVSLRGIQNGEVSMRDEVEGKEYTVRPSILVNAAGPWIDVCNQYLGASTQYIGGTKGSHIVLRHPELRGAIGDHEFFFENKDGRIVLIFPLYDRVLIGTSDIPVDDPDAVRCTDEEVDYFLDLVKRVFPKISVRRADIVFRFSGVRPLAASKSKTAGQITRDHEIQVLDSGDAQPPFPVLSLVGGKWTSWRAFAEQATDRCLAILRRVRKVETSRLAIGGGREYPRNADSAGQLIDGLVAQLGASGERGRALFERYGTRAGLVAGYIGEGSDIALKSNPDYSRREVEYIALREKVVHLDDFLLRRSMLAMLGNVTRATLGEVALALAEVLHWDRDRVAAEVARCMDILRDKHQVQL
ncbi:MAG TPA: glycerol-3-phosphate dehydrogenase/oxidase [Anaerolineales bacterium]|nr:glycerol-3-phosphate dehydrogenase/oxidase [Anaerolineales bacterium]